MVALKAGLTLGQMLRAAKAVKSLPKQKIATLPQMPKKTGWKKPLFPKSKMFPSYSKYDLAIDTGIGAAAYGTYTVLSKKKKKNKKQQPKKYMVG